MVLKKRFDIYLKWMQRNFKITFVLVSIFVISSFFLISSLGKLFLLQRQIEKSKEYYNQVGILVSQGASDNEIKKGIELVEKNQYVSIVDKRTQHFVELTDIYNGDLQGALSESMFGSNANTNVYNSDFIFSGNLLEVSNIENNSEKAPIPNTINDGEFKLTYHFMFMIDEVISGYPDYAVQGDRVDVYYYSLKDDKEVMDITELKVGEKYLIKTYYDWDISLYQSEKELNPSESLILKPLDKENMWYKHVEDKEELSKLIFSIAGLQQEMQIQNMNRHALNMIATKDMKNIPFFMESQKVYYLTDGRYLNYEDYAEKRNVCVIRDEFAKKRNLKIGDTIKVMHRKIDTSLMYYMYINSEDIFTEKTEVETAIFKIVGTYSAYPSQYNFDKMETYYNDIYVPASQIPNYFINTNEKVEISNFSFLLKEAEDIDKFVNGTKDELSKLRLTVSFLGNSNSEFMETALAMRQEAIRNAIAFTIVFVIILFLAIYFYLKDAFAYLILQRFLGISEKKSLQYLKSTFMLHCNIGFIVGGIFSWILTNQKFVADTLLQKDIISTMYWLGLILLCVLFSDIGIHIGIKRCLNGNLIEVLGHELMRRNVG